MDRRAFIRVAAAGAALGAALTSGCAPGDAELAHPELLDVLGERTVRDIGRQYRETHLERDPDVLRALIDGHRVRVDFAAGNVVVVDGWVLSRTEARQCALFDLLRA